MKYVYTLAGPVLILATVAEISVSKFKSPKALAHELKDPDVSASLGHCLYFRTKDDKFFNVDLDDILNKQLAGINEYSSVPDMMRTKIIESWIEITGKTQ